MNSCWNGNLIIFVMELVSTSSHGWIKIIVFGAHQESTLGQTWTKLPKIFDELGFEIKPWKMIFNIVWPLVNPGLTRGILVILAEKGTLGALMSEQVVPCHFGCLCSPMERKWYFWIFGAWHANRGQTKYDINIMAPKRTDKVKEPMLESSIEGSNYDICDYPNAKARLDDDSSLEGSSYVPRKHSRSSH